MRSPSEAIIRSASKSRAMGESLIGIGSGRSRAGARRAGLSSLAVVAGSRRRCRSCRACRSTPTSCGCCRSDRRRSAAFRRFLQDFGSLDHLYVVFESPDAIGEHARPRRRVRRRAAAGAGDRVGRRPALRAGQGLELPVRPGALSARRRRAPPRRWRAFGRRGSTREIAHARDLLSMPSAAGQGARPAGSARTADDAARSHGPRERASSRSTRRRRATSATDGRSRLVIVKPKGAAVRHRFLQGALPTARRRSNARRAATRQSAIRTRRRSRSRRPARIACRSKPSS